MKKVYSQENKLFIFCKYVLFFIVFYLLQKAQINGVISPFGFGIYFALIWCNQNILILSPLYIASSYLNNFVLYDLYSAIATCIIMMLIYGVHLKLKKPIKPMLMLLYALISQAVYVFLKIYSGTIWWIVCVELVFGLLYMFACMKVFESLIVRGITRKFTLIQTICLGAFFASLTCGLRAITLFDFDFAKLFLAFVVIFSTLVLPILESALLTMVFSAGTLLYDNNAYLVAPIIIWWLVCSCFRGRHRIFACLSLIVTELMCVYYFNFYYTTSFITFLPCIISGLVALCIPKAYYQALTENYNSSFVNRSLETIINRNRDNIHKRLLKLSQVFGEMDKVFRSMIKGKESENELKSLLVTEIKSKLCASCPEKNRCHKTYGDETNSILTTLSNVAFEKGRITLLDIPSVLTGRCFKINQLVYTVNDLIEQYKSYASLLGSIDASKVLISEQLYGVSNVLKDLAKDVGKNVIFDNGLEKEIIDELVYNDIVCSDAIVYHENQNVVSCVLEVRKEDSLKSKINSIVSKVCKTKMLVETDESSSHAGWQILNLKTAPKYDIIFGTSAHTKSSSTKSGDSYSIIRIEDGKILMALCDGMGSGEKAERTSQTAISLVENFYKAGFESDIILSSVNKFLSLGSTDVFSCLDMAIIDLKNGSADFVKLGATNGFIKHGDTISVIECNALPLGIISNATPTIKTTMLHSGDMIVICTDGVTDSFANDDEMTDFVNNINSLNPQEVADTLMDKALENYHQTALDDMTIVVAKIFAR